MGMIKEAIKNDAIKAEFLAYIDEKKPETVDALIGAAVESAKTRVKILF